MLVLHKRFSLGSAAVRALLAVAMVLSSLGCHPSARTAQQGGLAGDEWRARTVALLQKAREQDGGFSDFPDASAFDFETTYHMVKTLALLGVTPQHEQELVARLQASEPSFYTIQGSMRLHEAYRWAQLAKYFGLQAKEKTRIGQAILALLTKEGYCSVYDGAGSKIGLQVLATFEAATVLSFVGEAAPEKTATWAQGVWRDDAFIDEAKPYEFSVARRLLELLLVLGVKPAITPERRSWLQSQAQTSTGTSLVREFPLSLEYFAYALELPKSTGVDKPSPAKEATESIMQLQGESGAFKYPDSQVPDAKATYLAVKILKELGRDVPRREELISWLLRHELPAGGFRPVPTSVSTSLLTTCAGLSLARRLEALPAGNRELLKQNLTDRLSHWEALPVDELYYGLKALSDLGEPLPPVGRLAANLGEYANSPLGVDTLGRAFSATRIAALTHEDLRTGEASGLLAAIEALRKPGGGYGFGDHPDLVTTYYAVGTVRAIKGQARDELTVRWLQDQQQADGGFAQAGSTSDMHTTYAIVRSLSWLGALPRDTNGLRSWLRSAQHPQGGYGLVARTAKDNAAWKPLLLPTYWAEEIQDIIGRTDASQG